MDFNEAGVQRSRLERWDEIEKEILDLKDDRDKLAGISGNAQYVEEIESLRIERRRSKEWIVLHHVPCTDYELKVFFVKVIDEKIKELRELQSGL